MTWGILALAGIVLVAVFFSFRAESIFVKRNTNLGFLPDNETVYLAEKYMQTRINIDGEMIDLVGRPDLVTIDLNNVLHVYDFKNRKPGAVYFKEKMQLAAYAHLLRATESKEVSPITRIVFLGAKVPFSSDVDISKINIVYQVQSYIKDLSVKTSVTKSNKCTWCQYNSICS